MTAPSVRVRAPSSRALALLGAALLGTPAAPADEPNPSFAQAELLRTVTALDAALFDAYNRCDLDRLGVLVAEDLEFYHDQTGLSRGRAAFLEAIRKSICGKVHRDLVPGTLQAYPLAHYGAVELGVHVFCDPRQSARCDPAQSAVAQFVMLWREAGGGWQLARVISYDHRSAEQRANSTRHERQ